MSGALFGGFSGGYFFTCDVQGDVRGRGASVRIRVQDYKSLCVAVVIWPTLVNTQTDRHTDRHDIRTDEQRVGQLLNRYTR